MSKVFLSLLILISCFFALPQDDGESVEEKRVEVVVGIDKSVAFSFAFSTNIQISDSSVVKIVRTIPNQRKIILRGLRKGKTSLDVYDKVGDLKLRYIVDVTSDEKSKIVAELVELIGDVEGIEIGIKGGAVYVGGQIYVPGDIGRVLTVLNRYDDILRLVEMAPQAQIIIARKMQEELVRNNYRDINVRIVNKKYFVEGTVASISKDIVIIRRIVNAYLPDKLDSIARSTGAVTKTKNNSSAIYFLNENPKKQKPQPPPKQVKVTSQFVELTKDYSKLFAFKWAPLLGDNGGQVQIGETADGGVSTNSSGVFGALISNLLPKLTSAKNAGYARVIQSGMVITEVEKQATLNKSSQQNIAVGSAEQGVSQPIPVTVKFTMGVTPRIFPDEKVEMSINLNVSVPGEAAANGTPTVVENSISTAIIVKSKASAVIGGVVQSSTNTSYDRDPFEGGDTQGGSALFSLLRAKRYAVSKNQYVVFVTPEIIETASAGTAEIKKKFRKRQRR